MSSAVGPLLTAFGAYSTIRHETSRVNRAEAQRNASRRSNLLEYEAGRRARESDLRRSLSRLRADRLAAGFSGSLSLRAQEGGLLREFAEDENLERDRLGLRNEKVGLSGRVEVGVSDRLIRAVSG
ncbi:MAG: hypothetical protein OD811_05800 [Alphaproteobacteria bacterium]